MAVQPAPLWVPSQRPLAPSVMSVTSVANKGDNEMILGVVYKISARRPSDVGAVRLSNGVPFLQMR